MYSEVINSIGVSVISEVLIDVTKKILKSDPFQAAVEQTLDEVRIENPDEWIILEEIYLNKNKIFYNVKMTSKENFCDMLADYGIKAKTSLKLYRKINKKFNEIINKVAQKNQDVFLSYAIMEFKKIDVNISEILNVLSVIAQTEKIYLDVIIEYFRKLEKKENDIAISQLGFTVYHPTEYLQWGQEKDADPAAYLTRSGGPLWSDFKNELVYQRKNEITQIWSMLHEGLKIGNTIYHISMIKGNTATGKSVLANNIAYDYGNSSSAQIHRLYAIDISDRTFNAIRYLNEKKGWNSPLVIIDDIHQAPEIADELMAKVIANKLSNINFLLVTRDYEVQGEEHTTLKDYIEKKACINLAGKYKDVASEIISHFLKLNNCRVSEKDIEKIIENSRENLWILSYYLASWKRKNFELMPEPNDIFDEIEKYIQLIGRKYRLESDSVRDVLITLSVFSRLELNMDKKFFPEKDHSVLQGLADTNEIIEETIGGRRYYRVPHSAVAELFLKTAKKKWYVDFTDDFEFSTIIGYCNDEKTKDIGSIGYAIHWGSEANREVITSKINTEILAKKINNESNVERIGYCIFHTVNASKELANELVLKIDIEILEKKIITKSAIRDIFGLFFWIQEGDTHILAEKLASKIDIIEIAKKIDNEPDISQIGYCINQIWSANNEVGELLFSKINVEVLAKKIDLESNFKTIHSLIFNIIYINRELTKKLTSIIHIEILAEKINLEPDITEIRWCLSHIADANKDIARMLVSIINIDGLGKKIDNEPDIEKNGECISEIVKANKDAARALVSMINIERLKDKIDNEPDIKKIGKCISSVADANNEVAENLIEIVAKRIDCEPKIEEICSLSVPIKNSEFISKLVSKINIENLAKKINLGHNILAPSGIIHWVAEANNEIARLLIPNVDIDTLAKKISIESDIAWIGYCISSVSKANNDAAEMLVSKISIEELIRKINEENNLYEIIQCFLNISQINNVLINRILSKINIDELAKKIDHESDIGIIIMFCGLISDTNKELIGLLIPKINVDVLSRKINNEPEVKNIGLCLILFEETNKELAKELISKIDIEGLVRKIDLESDIEIIGLCYYSIAKANPESLKILIKRIDLKRIYSKISETKDCFSLICILTGIGISDKEIFKEFIKELSEPAIKAIQVYKPTFEYETTVLEEFKNLVSCI